MLKGEEKKPGKQRVETQQCESLSTAGRYLEAGVGGAPDRTQEGGESLFV